MIGVATIVVDQDCNNYGLSCNDSVFFATMVVGVATIVVGVATIVVDVTILNIMTIVITTRCPNPPANRQVLTLTSLLLLASLATTFLWLSTGH